MVGDIRAVARVGLQGVGREGEAPAEPGPFAIGGSAGAFPLPGGVSPEAWAVQLLMVLIQQHRRSLRSRGAGRNAGADVGGDPRDCLPTL